MLTVDLFRNLFSMGFIKFVRRLDADMPLFFGRAKLKFLSTRASVRHMNIASGMMADMLSERPEMFLRLCGLTRW